MAKAKVKMALIQIIPDSNEDNAKNDQFHYYQKDGETVRVAVGEFQTVPIWVAERAKEIGEIKNYKIVEVEEEA